MFDKDYYINYIRKYIPVNERHNVQWIENNVEISYDSNIIDSQEYPMTEPDYLARPCDEFDSSNIDCFHIKNNSYPYRSEWAELFSTEGIYSSFTSNEVQYPYPTPWAAHFDGNGVFSYFFIRNSYPFPVDWLEPFDANNIYSLFFFDNNFFHGYPNIKDLPTFDSTPESWIPIASDEIDKTFEVYGEKEITTDTFEDLNEIIRTQTETLQIKDRDEYKDDYLAILDAYWQRQASE